MLTSFLTGLLSSIIRPIIQEELKDLKEFALEQYERLQSFERIDAESLELITAAENATTTEEVKAHLRNLKATRAKLNN